jgi:RNA polymerase sigma factor (sigma-70 family)
VNSGGGEALLKMPRTESGPATCNPRPQNLLPITERDRRDTRFLNSLSKPPCPDDEPTFDRGRFRTFKPVWHYLRVDDRGRQKSRGAAVETQYGYEIPAAWEYEKRGRGRASCGGNVSAKVIGSDTSYERLISTGRSPLNLVAATIPGAPPGLSRFIVVAIVNHRSKLFRPHKVEHDDGTVTIKHVLFVRHNGRLLRHTGFRCWFGQKYPYRWNQAVSCYLDIRIVGKATNSFDLTGSQAAAGLADETLGNISTRPKPPKQISFEHWGRTGLRLLNGHELEHLRRRQSELVHGGVGLGLDPRDHNFPSLGEWGRANECIELLATPYGCPRCFYEMPVFGFFWLWLVAYLESETEPQASQTRLTSHYWHEAGGWKHRGSEKSYSRSISWDDLEKFKRTGELPEIGVLPRHLGDARVPGLRELLSREALNRGKNLKSPRPVVATARDRALLRHLPLVKSKCRIVPESYRKDAIQACMERLVKAWDKSDPEQPFGAAQAIDWAIQDFMKQLRQQIPVQRSINLNDPADNPTDDDDDQPPEPEQTDMMRVNALQGQVTVARRRLVAERLDCLNWRERRVIEGRLALNGHADPVSRWVLAADLGISETLVRQIESQAALKLQLAICPKENTIQHCGNAAPDRIY